VDVDSQQTGTTVNTTISATMQNCQVTTLIWTKQTRILYYRKL